MTESKELEELAEDTKVFGEDQWVYCNQHLRPHKTGWCTVGVRNKVGLGVATREEGLQKCKDFGFEIFAP